MEENNSPLVYDEFFKRKYSGFVDFNEKLFKRLKIICKEVYFDEDCQCYVKG